MVNDIRTISWTGSSVRVIDQTQLPHRLAYLDLDDVDGLVQAIQRLVVRGAPALGATGALGVVVAMRQGQRDGWSAARLVMEVRRIRGARPTASNLAWAVDKMSSLMAQGETVVLRAALQLMAGDEVANRSIGRNGADWVLGHVRCEQVRVLTHCNAGALATTAWGTALGVIRELSERGALEVVYVNETRPLLQGARLTAWELDQEHIPHIVQADSAAASTIVSGAVDVAIIGADRIAANGDTANKIGSLAVALACHYAEALFVVAAPTSTIDLETETGGEIPIELRSEDEVLTAGGTRTAPWKSRAHNPAFDVTPARFISALVTEAGVLEVAKGETPRSANDRTRE
jgi:methylthioribose-1-phosphate isomerase